MALDFRLAIALFSTPVSHWVARQPITYVERNQAFALWQICCWRVVLFGWKGMDPFHGATGLLQVFPLLSDGRGCDSFFRGVDQE